MVEKVTTFTKTHLVAILASAIIACLMLSAGGAWAKYIAQESVTESLNFAVSAQKDFTIVYHGNGGTKAGDDKTTTYTQTCAVDTAAGTLKEEGTLIANQFTNGDKTFGFWTLGTETDNSITTTYTKTCVDGHAFPKGGDSIITPTTAGTTIHLWAYWLDEGAGNYWMENANSAYPANATYSGKDTTQVIKGQEEIDTNQDDTTFWNSLYNNGTDTESHLYTIWQEDAVLTFANRFVESRIIQVGAHDGDGSAVTFMATHSLPTAQKMNSTNTNAGGWTGSGMYQTMNADGGYVMTGLSDLASAVTPVTKVSTAGSYGSWTTTTSQDSFWLLSYSELVGENKGDDDYKNEGSQYDWCKTNVTNPTGANPAIAGMDKTRAGSSPAGAGNLIWWERSPYVYYSGNFGYVSTSGNPYGDYYAYIAGGVVPAFSM